ncbi:unnamed protein product [Amoebophrya sp. A120]|nr:unnamed protein product [Amoebophrya sp. A120]|eukprot:GSA120T00004126001.1
MEERDASQSGSGLFLRTIYRARDKYPGVYHSAKASTKIFTTPETHVDPSTTEAEEEAKLRAEFEASLSPSEKKRRGAEGSATAPGDADEDEVEKVNELLGVEEGDSGRSGDQSHRSYGSPDHVTTKAEARKRLAQSKHFEDIDDNDSDEVPHHELVTLETIAWRIHDADRGIFVNEYPTDRKSWNAFIDFLTWNKRTRKLVIALLIVNFIRVPIFCLRDPTTIWQRRVTPGDANAAAEEPTDIYSFFTGTSSSIVVDTGNPDVCPPDLYLSNVPTLNPVVTSLIQIAAFLVFALKLHKEYIYKKNFKSEEDRKKCMQSTFPYWEWGCVIVGGVMSLLMFVAFQLQEIGRFFDAGKDASSVGYYCHEAKVFMLNHCPFQLITFASTGMILTRRFMKTVVTAVLNTVPRWRNILALFIANILFFGWATQQVFTTQLQEHPELAYTGEVPQSAPSMLSMFAELSSSIGGGAPLMFPTTGKDLPSAARTAAAAAAAGRATSEERTRAGPISAATAGSSGGEEEEVRRMEKSAAFALDKYPVASDILSEQSTSNATTAAPPSTPSSSGSSSSFVVPPGTPENPDIMKFSTFASSVESYFYMGTTANFPDEMLPAMQGLRWLALLYLFFMFMGAVVFTNLVLATVYSQYEEFIKQDYLKLTTHTTKGLEKAFVELQDLCGDYEGLSIGDMHMLVTVLNSLPEMTPIDISVLPFMFEMLDHSRDRRLGKEEFFNLFSAIHLRIWVTKRDSPILELLGESLALHSNDNHRHLVGRKSARILMKHDEYYQHAIEEDTLEIVRNAGVPHKDRKHDANLKAIVNAAFTREQIAAAKAAEGEQQQVAPAAGEDAGGEGRLTVDNMYVQMPEGESAPIPQPRESVSPTTEMGVQTSARLLEDLVQTKAGKNQNDSPPPSKSDVLDLLRRSVGWEKPDKMSHPGGIQTKGLVKDPKEISRTAKWLFYVMSPERAQRIFKFLKRLQLNVESGAVDDIIGTVLLINLVYMIADGLVSSECSPAFQAKWKSNGETVELIFSIIYMGEVCAKLSVMSFAEYWKKNPSNQFDFFTSVALFSVSMVRVSGIKGASGIIRSVNIIRILRLVRILARTRQFRDLLVSVTRMVLVCEEIICLLFVCLLFFASLGQMGWGGMLGKTNPSPEDLDRNGSYYSSHTALNFNDIGMGIFTLISIFFSNAFPDLVQEMSYQHPWPWYLQQVLPEPFGTGLIFCALVWFVQTTLMFNLYVAFSIACIQAESRKDQEFWKNWEPMRKFLFSYEKRRSSSKELAWWPIDVIKKFFDHGKDIDCQQDHRSCKWLS